MDISFIITILLIGFVGSFISGMLIYATAAKTWMNIL